MDHRKNLTKLHGESKKKVDDLIKSKGKLKKGTHEKVHAAKEEWDVAWNKMMEILLVLERLEI